MKKMKNYLKFVTLFIGASMMLWNCQKDEVSEVKQLNTNTIIVKTVSLEDAKNIFQTFQKNQPKAKGNENLVVTPDWNTLSQKPLFYTDAMLTKVDVEINREGNFTTEILFINVNGEMKSVLYTLYVDSTTSDGKLQNARVYLTELNGEYIDGYRFLNGLIKTRILPKRENNVGASKNSAAKVADYPTSFWGGTSASPETGGDGDPEAGGCIDCVQLDEVVIYGYLNPTDPYAELDGYFNPVNEFTDIDNGVESGSGSGGITGITVSTTEDVTTAIVIEPITICGDGFILINGKCEVQTEIPNPDQIINNLTDPCAKDIFTELENGIYTTDPIKPEVIIPNANLTELNFSETILKLFSDSSNTDLTIQNGTTNNGSNASTVSSTITLSDSYIQTATQLSISRTIIHETIHAYLNGVFHSYPDFKNLSLRDKLRQYAIDNGYSDVNRFQHEFMGQYVNAMAYSLYEWDKDYGTGGDLGWDYYYSMGFAGLIYAKKDSDGDYILDSSGYIIYEDTDSFKELITDQADRDKIKKIISDEAEGNSNAKGEKC